MSMATLAGDDPYPTMCCCYREERLFCFALQMTAMMSEQRLLRCDCNEKVAIDAIKSKSTPQVTPKC
jgi:putative component of membrane protein insertase Oxa1/YidC/SpoIIIJ protein YidD